jgi:DNA-binding NtrC family response regulator
MNKQTPVLLIEDNEDTLDTLEILLESSGFECRRATSRDKALEILKSGFLPGCVLMDYMMPGMSLTRFLSEAADMNLKIMLVSAHSDIHRLSKRFGIRHFIQKPIDPDELIHAVKTTIESGQHSAV